MTKLTTIIERETTVPDAEGRPLILGIWPTECGNFITLRPKNVRGAKGDVRRITIGDLWRTLGKADSVPARPSQNGGATRAEVLRDLRAKLQTLPRRDVDYKEGIRLVGQALDALEELERYLAGDQPEEVQP